MFRSQLLWRLYASHVAVIILSTLIVGTLVSRQVLENGMNEINHSLEVRAELLAELTKDVLLDRLQSIGSGTLFEMKSSSLQQTVEKLGENTESRLTVIASDGTVIADSQETPDKMDNHAQRPEVIDARELGSGSTSRFSQTLQQQMIYRALKVSDNQQLLGYVRVSLPRVAIDKKLAELRLIVLFGAGVSALAALLLGFYFAKRFSDPLRDMTEIAEAISQGDYQRRISIDSDGEMAKLAAAFNRMARSSEQRMDEITADRNRLAMIFAGMVEGVIGVDQQQNIIHINQAAANLLKLNSSACQNKPIWEQVRSIEITQALDQVLVSGGVVKSQMRSSNKPDAQVVDIYVAALGDNNAELIGAVIVLHDISELSHLETIRHDFVANASHELKTPITAIRAMTETILDNSDMDAETQHSFTQKIHDQSLRLSSLITDLLVISKFDSDQHEQHYQDLDLGEAVRRSVAEAKLSSQEKGLSVTTEIAGEKIMINADMQAISQLIDNLLGNAIKYTPAKGEVLVSLSTYKGNAILLVKDTGIGISPQHQQRIFERFYRIDTARSRELGGTGLGLSIVKNIAEQHGGSVSLESQQGRGSTFKIILPLK